MILYHGTNVDIASISLNMCRPYKDFGKGFYLTSLEEQARKMAYRVSKIYGGKPVINMYEIDNDFLLDKELAIMDFGTEVTEEWATFVMNNRNRNFFDYGKGDYASQKGRCNIWIKRNSSWSIPPRTLLNISFRIFVWSMMRQ